MTTHRPLLLMLLALAALAGCDAQTADPATDGGPGDGAPPGVDPDDGVPPDDPTLPPPAGACDPIEAFFAERIWAGFMSTACVGCHIEGGAAAASRLHLVPRLDNGGLDHNLAQLRPLAAERAGNLSLLVAKPTGRHPNSHGGGALLRPDGEEAAALAWLARRLGEPVDPCENGEGPVVDDPAVNCQAPPPGPRALRRLSHVEYGNTLQALLGVHIDVKAALTPDEVVEGFDNHRDALDVSDLLADQYRTLAEEAAAAAQLAPLLDCAPAAGDRRCARAFIVDFGRRALRRPLTADDIDRYLAIYDLVAPDDGFEAAIRWVITAFLQSPHFLYRTELGRRDGDGFRLTAYELASGLSYLIWQSPPDDALLDAAARGVLYEAAGLAAEAERLLADPRSEATMLRFAWRWLELEQLETVPRDPTTYPELTPEIRHLMAGETARLIGEAWRDGGDIEDILLARHGYLTDALAAFYGLPPSNEPVDAEGYRRRDLSGTPYGGLLKQGAILTTHALPTTSSPIHRGLMVRERLLCQPLPPPPVNLDISPPPVEPGLSTRERYAQHSDDPACAGCHGLIDPIGFAFEHFDGIGRWRETDGMHAIDATGEIIGSGATDGAFDGVDALAALLAGSPEVEACYAEQWLRNGFGGLDAMPAECYIDRLLEAPGGLRGVVPAITRLPRFTHRSGGEGELDVAGADLLPRPEDIPPGGLDAPPPIDDPPPEPEPEPGPGPVGDVAFQLVEQSRWNTGYCADGVVTNRGAGEVRWTVEANIEGTINNAWNVERSADSGRVRFSGADWNAVIGPAQEARFGFCADL
ncbi:MAG: DUF1592 domain-containing protein [bacterium]